MLLWPIAVLMMEETEEATEEAEEEAPVVVAGWLEAPEVTAAVEEAGASVLEPAAEEEPLPDWPPQTASAALWAFCSSSGLQLLSRQDMAPFWRVSFCLQTHSRSVSAQPVLVIAGSRQVI